MVGIGEGEHRSGGEGVFQLVKGGLAFFSPLELGVLLGQLNEGLSDLSHVRDEPLVVAAHANESAEYLGVGRGFQVGYGGHLIWANSYSICTDDMAQEL